MGARTAGALWVAACAASLHLVGQALRERSSSPPPAPPVALPRPLLPAQRAAVEDQAAALTRLAREAEAAPPAGALESLSGAPLVDNLAAEGVGGVVEWCEGVPVPEADWLYCRATRTVVPGGTDYQPSPATKE